MKPRLTIIILAISLTTNYSLAEDWWQFRGKGGASVANANLPTEFDDDTNISWKMPLPGKGASSPIVVDGKVIVTCSGGDNQDQLYAVAFDEKTGKKLWTQKFWATGRCFVHSLSANAAPTPVTDGKQIYVFFSSNDLACLDLDGNLVWYRALAVDHPKAGNDVGMASSPAVQDGVVVVQIECQGDSFAMGLDTSNGTTIWSRERAKVAVWTSPLIVQLNNQPPNVLLQSVESFDLLDLKTGEPVFNAEGSVSSISSSAFTDGKLFVPIDGTTAYSVSGDGQLNKEWNSPKMRPSSMSSVVHDNKIYTLSGRGVLSTFSAIDGTEKSRVRVINGKSAWATPVIADGYMYLFAEEGQSYVVELPSAPNDEPKVVSEHTFDGETFLGSPAVANNAMFVRSDKFLWKIAGSN